MADPKLKKMGDRAVRVVTSDGKFVLDIEADEQGKLTVKETKVRDDEPEPKPKRVRSIFDPVQDEPGTPGDPD